MENTEEICEMIWKIWKKIVIRYGQYGRKGKLNSEKSWKILKKSGWWWWWWWWQTFVRNVIIEINNVIMKIKWRGRGR